MYVCVCGQGGMYCYIFGSVTAFAQDSSCFQELTTAVLSLDAFAHRMLFVLIFAALCASCLAKSTLVHYSYSRAVGAGSGSSFSTDGEGRVTAVRLWEINNAYITGIQLRYDFIWSKTVGRVYGTVKELELFDDEVIVQISGKYHSNYIYQLIFVTSRGRLLTAGQPISTSFNFYPIHKDAELRLLSGRYNGNGITALGAYWGVVYMEQSNSTDISTE